MTEQEELGRTAGDKEEDQEDFLVVNESELQSDSHQDTLSARLAIAHRNELQGLAEVCVVKGHESKTDDELRVEIAKNLRYYGGSWVMNTLRPARVFPYKKILIDVADKISEGFTFLSWSPFKASDSHTEEEVEDYIWRQCERLVRDQLKRLDDAQKEALVREIQQEMTHKGMTAQALKTFTGAGMGLALGVIITEIIALDVLFGVGSRGLLAVFGVSTSTGVGVVVAAITVAAMIQGTAYRVTIPACVRLISIRKRAQVEAEIEAEQNQVPVDPWVIYDELCGYGPTPLLSLAALEASHQPNSNASLTRATLTVRNQDDITGFIRRMEAATWFAREDIFFNEFANAEGFRLRAEEALVLVRMLVFASARREAIVAMAPRILDKQNMESVLIMGGLEDPFDRSLAIDALRHTPSHHN